MMRFLLLILASLISTFSIAQTSLRDTSFFSASVNNAIRQYESAIDRQQLFYNGSAYVETEGTGDSHPYFLSNDYVYGSIVYNDNTFHNVPLMYDIQTDQLVTDSPTGTVFAINRKKLQRFTIRDHHFEFIDKGEANNGLPRTSFYDVLYDGPSKLLAHYEKNIQEKISSRSIEVYFEERTRYFVRKDNQYYPVRNKGTILKVFSNQKQMLKNLIRKEHINFKGDKPKALSRVAELYDSLIQSGK